MTTEFHRPSTIFWTYRAGRKRKERREKIFFVVKEKDYFTAENAKDAEKRTLLFKRKRQYQAEGKQKTEVGGQKSESRSD